MISSLISIAFFKPEQSICWFIVLLWWNDVWPAVVMLCNIFAGQQYYKYLIMIYIFKISESPKFELISNFYSTFSSSLVKIDVITKLSGDFTKLIKLFFIRYDVFWKYLKIISLLLMKYSCYCLIYWYDNMLWQLAHESVILRGKFIKIFE